MALYGIDMLSRPLLLYVSTSTQFGCTLGITIVVALYGIGILVTCDTEDPHKALITCGAKPEIKCLYRLQL